MTRDEIIKLHESTANRKISGGQTVFMYLLFAVLAAGLICFFLFVDFIPSKAFYDYPLYLFLYTGFVLMVVNVVFFAWQILLVMQYKTYPVPDDDSKLPTLGVIVPAFNEGQQVSETLKSLLASNYPKDKLEIITVNDGSKDDTWEWMHTAVSEGGGRLIAMDLPKNAGKRNALYKGLLVSSAEVIVTIDSDSIVLPDTIREIAAPFAADPSIGGVAGNIRVLNTDGGMIPKMLDVSFVFGFEFLRSAQSMVRAVLCTPGALSAYRREAILPHMNEWVNEKFFGKPANIGEDRAITNILIREGWGIVFQRTATIYTEMPTTYKGLCKMMIRWSRSNVRENYSMSKFAYKRFDLNNGELTGMQANLLVQIFWMIAPILFAYYTVQCMLIHAYSFWLGLTVSICFWSTLPAFVFAQRYDRKKSLWSYVYGFYSFLTLFWISPYSLFTVTESGWLTRQAPKPAAAPPQNNQPTTDQ